MAAFRKSTFVLCLVLIFSFLTGCTPAQTTPATDEASNPETATLRARVIDADENGALLLAGLDEDGGVYRNTMPEDAQTYAPGMLLRITYSGYILESYPAQLSSIQSVQIVEEEFDDRCRLYMDVLLALWDEDEGLQADTAYVGLDLSQTALKKSEQDALAWRFGELKQKEPLTGTLESLQADGYIERDLLLWSDGCLFKIEEKESNENSVTFDAQKWRSGDGAYYFMDCTATRDQTGVWQDYTVGRYAIS